MARKPNVSAGILNLAPNGAAITDSTLKISFLGASPYTFEGWVCLDGLTDQSDFITKPGEFHFGFRGQSLFVQRTNQTFCLSTPNILGQNTWYHIAVTYSENGTLTIYLNGIRQAEMITFDPGISDQGQPFAIGQGFSGKIQEARFWNCWRSESDIFQNQYSVEASANLLADFDFSQDPMQDLSGNHHTVTLQADDNGYAYTDVVCPAMALSGGSYAEPVMETEINPGTGADPYSVQAWVYQITPDGVQTVFANGNWSEPTGMALYIDNGVLKAMHGNNTILTGQSVLEANEWHNVAVVFNGSVLQLYLNGQLEASMTAPQLPPRPQGSPIIGAAHDSQEPTTDYYFQGYIQTVLIWSIALSAADINQWMNNDPLGEQNIVGYYNFTTSPAENLYTSNSLGLVDGAFIAEVHISSTDSIQSRKPLRHRAKGWRHPYDVNARAIPFAQAHLDSVVDEYAYLLGEMVPEQQRNVYLSRFRQELQQIFAEIAANPEQIPQGAVHYRQEDGDWVFYEHTENGIMEVHRINQEENLDECTIWLISYVWNALNAFLSVLGVPTISQRGLTFVQRLARDSGMWNFFVQTVTGRVTGISAILAILTGVYEFGYMVSFLKFVITTLSWWAITKLIIKAISYFVPGLAELELAAYIANAVVAIAQLEWCYLQKPAQCYNALEPVCICS